VIISAGPPRDLVIVTAGDDSHHVEFENDRKFDLWVVYWGSNVARAKIYLQNSDRLIRSRGLKWELVRSLIDCHLSQSRSPFADYRYIFLPDDDLSFPNGAEDISRLFESAAAVRADIFQPAIANENWSQDWNSTRQEPNCYCHATNIVELMMPGYESRIFAEILLPLLNALEFQRAGWGIEPQIARFAEVYFRRPIRTFVFDDVPVDHVRPVGKGTTSHEIGYDEAFLTPMVYSNRIKTYAKFSNIEEARAFEFPYLYATSDSEALANHMSAIRVARSLLLDFNRARTAVKVFKRQTLVERVRANLRTDIDSLRRMLGRSRRA
jgi:hypothetical protein